MSNITNLFDHLKQSDKFAKKEKKGKEMGSEMWKYFHSTVYGLCLLALVSYSNWNNSHIKTTRKTRIWFDRVLFFLGKNPLLIH